LPFGKITEDVGNTMKSLGMLGMEGSGMVRLNVRDEKGMKGMRQFDFYSRRLFVCLFIRLFVRSFVC
jgi:hypothetical protein